MAAPPSCLNSLRKTNLRYPVTEDILRTLRGLQLTRDRVQRDPRFLFATELVSTNFERHETNYEKCKLYAQFFGHPLILYPLTILRGLQNYTIEQQTNLRENNRTVLYGYFVSGMPGMIMENICTAKGITNGTICIQHAILFNDHKGLQEEIQ